jgi:aryl-alcohol dehydrogenase-like predicted oxidoreductase
MRLALGTVQFGLAYGIAGRGEIVPENEVRAILEDAAKRGVHTLDTASAYGDIEQRLAKLSAGLPLGIVSKVPAIPDSLAPQQAVDFALRAADLCFERLGSHLCGLMLHRGADLMGERGDALALALRTWCCDRGISFGASCYSPREAAELAATHGITLTQLPGNALDQRVGCEVEGLTGVEVHLRSAFLQGLLLMPQQQAQSKLPQAAEFLSKWHAACRAADRSPLEMALSVVKSFSAVSAVVVGVDTLSQWIEIAQAWDHASPTEALDLRCFDPRIIDPRLWNSPV